MKSWWVITIAACILAVSCEVAYNEVKGFPEGDEEQVSVRLDEVAEILAGVPLQASQMGEVRRDPSPAGGK